MSIQVPEEERVCVNCKYYRAIWWSIFAWADRIIGTGADYHRCIKGGTETKVNKVTGKKSIKINSGPCATNRSVYRCDSENMAISSFEPSNKWLKRKENLFKILKSTE